MKNRLYFYDESDNDSVNLSMTTQHNYKRFLIRQISKDNTKSALKGKNVITVNKISEILTKAVKVRLITKKSRIRETPTLSTNADSRTDTNLKKLRDLSLKKSKKK